MTRLTAILLAVLLFAGPLSAAVPGCPMAKAEKKTMGCHAGGEQLAKPCCCGPCSTPRPAANEARTARLEAPALALAPPIVPAAVPQSAPAAPPRAAAPLPPPDLLTLHGALLI